MRVVKYQRVSTESQDYENQTKSIDRQIELLGWTCVGEYKETVSGSKSRDTRPELRKLLRDSRLRKFDRVIVYSLDRLGRSTVDVINTLHELDEVGVQTFIVKDSIDTSTTQGKIFSQFISIFNQLEKDLILSRQKNSIERLREKEHKWGKGKLLSQEVREQIIKLREEGVSFRNISKQLGVSVGGVQSTLRSV